MNLSDVISKGGAPLTLMFSWGIPGDYDLEAVAEIASGMDAHLWESHDNHPCPMAL